VFNPVLASLTKQMRLWATSLLVAAYALGVLVPAVAFSLDRHASIVHSIVEAHDGLLLLHVHHDDGDQSKSGQSEPHVGHYCCGIFALQSLLPPSTASLFAEFCDKLILAEPQEQKPVCKPSRLDRPPRITV
jgi:hypothetical protein